VYTPAGYEKSAARNYPLLVLQHGSGDNHKTWVEHGKAHWILDHLIAKGQAVPMVVMMLDGHPLGQVPRDAADRRSASLTAFRRELLEEALPLVESIYRVSPQREARAITGLSMGGWQSLSVGLNALDRFAWIGCFSGAVDEKEIAPALAEAAGTNARVKLLWVACGRDDFLLPRNRQLVATFTARGIKHEWRETAGDHSWPVWRSYLVEFVPRLFR
jgi:enterochelin esterase family protein